MKNLFDELNGYGDEGLDGLFSGIKKIGRKFDKARKRIGRKIDKSRKRIGRDLDKSGFNKVAAGVALAVVGGPAILAGVKGVGGFGALATKGLSAAKLGIKAGSVINTIKGSRAAADVSLARAQQAADTAQQLPRDPQFNEVVQRLRAQGLNDNQILSHWAASQSYRQMAVPQVARTIYPQVYSQVRAQGVPANIARPVAFAESSDIAENQVNKVASQFGGADIAKMVIPALLTFALTKVL